ncbi:MAG: DNA gyrase subunit A [Roseibacillus sp.]|jgi:DNA gyrase subunit A|nr:DNA gyrase subunit A [Roseibacillus sp.]MCP4731814.1 DNA gyrase subunit A [Roseibacillus sp.]MDP7308068.1 DNA gyrase subunit A [Roseibacillus sp.]MDP7655371.1 DNA gyrase subunit A [Roseibacillus sp.]HJM63815.1 DNA gyrase subunit A [Roseibacillus sp.]|tara:strand:- start:897 stop:3500 length:2604 start_codon:yes stop_codon:yes gene_type:complete
MSSEDDIKPINVADELSKSFLDYSMSVIVSRALPDVRDGLKPSQRRILYAMNDLALAPNKAHRKCAKICGDTSGNYHPHGEAVIYPTLVNMAQDWSMREILVDGQGNFGSPEADPPAAMRYTEARLTHLGMAMMADLDKRTVDFVPNYDETSTEPTVFPAAFPNLLVNGGTGIAVGMATNLPPHNLGEIVDALCAQIDNPEITLPELMQHVKGPDFPVACEIRGVKGIESYFATGRGSVKMRGKMEVDEKENGTAIITITEVPYGVNRATLQQRIAELVNQKILTGISGMRDLTDENTRIEITLKRDARPQVLVNQIYKLTAMETSFSVNMLAIHERRPKLLSLKEALDCYIEHRREVVVRRTRYLLEKAEDRAETLEALLLALGCLDDFIKMIRSSKSRDEAREKVRGYTFKREAAESLGVLIRDQPSLQGDDYVFTDRQVNAILELRLYQLVALEREKIKNDYDGVIEEIKDLMDILAKEARVLGIIKDELLEVKEKYGNPRKCEILPDEGEIAIEDLIANEGMICTLSHRGYVKRTSASEYRLQGRGGKGVRGMETRGSNEDDDDFVEHLFSAQAHDYLMFFTNTGRVYVERVYELPEGSRASKGRSIKNVLNLQPEESIAAMLRLERRLDEEGDDVTFGQDAGFVLFATRRGKVKKTGLYDFRNFRKDGIIAIKLDEGNELIDVRLTNGSDEIVLVTSNGLSLRFREEQARPMGRTAAGVAGIKPVGNDVLVGLALVSDQSTLLVASENGIGKRTSFGEYRAQTRGGKGIITMKVTGKTGQVVGAVAVEEDDELMLMTTGGQSIRIRCSEVRETGRNAQGVKLVTLRGDEKLQDIAKVVAGEGDEEESEDSGEDAPPDADQEE